MAPKNCLRLSLEEGSGGRTRTRTRDLSHGYYELQDARQGLVETQARNFLAAPASSGGPCMKHKASNSYAASLRKLSRACARSSAVAGSFILPKFTHVSAGMRTPPPSLEVERDLTCTMAGNVDHTQIGRKRKAVAFMQQMIDMHRFGIRQAKSPE